MLRRRARDRDADPAALGRPRASTFGPAERTCVQPSAVSRPLHAGATPIADPGPVAAPVVILSPHLDDAVLCCWHVLSGPADVRVINLFAGLPARGAAPGWWDRRTEPRAMVPVSCLVRCLVTRRLYSAWSAIFVSEWIAALGRRSRSKLERGAKVADIGCGNGASTIIMAEAFPNSRFYGYDYHAASIERGPGSRAHRRAWRTASRSRVAAAKELPGDGYDLVCAFDCLHDMGDPVGATPGTFCAVSLPVVGTWMIVEPNAGDIVRGQPQPDRTRLLRRLDGDLHPRLAGSGGWAGARGAGGRGASYRGDQAGRLRPRPAGHRDAVQHHPGGAREGCGRRPRWRGRLYPQRKPTGAGAGGSGLSGRPGGGSFSL